MNTWNSSKIEDRQNILIASQDEEMRNVWTTFFKEKNYQVIAEVNAKNALQTSRLLTPALTIIDLNLAHDEKIELCLNLRKSTEGALILLAQKDENLSDYYHSGVDEIISSPVNPMAVLIKSITWLARQQAISTR